MNFNQVIVVQKCRDGSKVTINMRNVSYIEERGSKTVYHFGGTLEFAKDEVEQIGDSIAPFDPQQLAATLPPR